MITKEIIDETINSDALKDFPLIIILKVIQELVKVEEELCEH